MSGIHPKRYGTSSLPAPQGQTWEEMDTASDIAHWNDAGQTIPVFSAARDFVHRMISLWLRFESWKPLDIRQILGRDDIWGEDCLGQAIRKRKHDFHLCDSITWINLSEGSSIGNEVRRDFLSPSLWMELLEGWVGMGRNSNSDDYIITALPIHNELSRTRGNDSIKC
jgi:hypothetical protein